MRDSGVITPAHKNSELVCIWSLPSRRFEFLLPAVVSRLCKKKNFSRWLHSQLAHKLSDPANFALTELFLAPPTFRRFLLRAPSAKKGTKGSNLECSPGMEWKHLLLSCFGPLTPKGRWCAGKNRKRVNWLNECTPVVSGRVIKRFNSNKCARCVDLSSFINLLQVASLQ